MKKILPALCAGMAALSVAPVQAALVYEGEYNPDQTMQEYFDAAYYNYNRPIIFVFFNNEPCYDCAETVALIEKVYNQNYKNLYSFFLINYQNDQEYNFIGNYNLSRPLEVVLQNVENGRALGYRKLENLQNMISDALSFSDYLTEEINSFFNN